MIVVLENGLGAWYLSRSTKPSSWSSSPRVEQFVEQGDRLEWHGDTERILGNAEQVYRRALKLDRENPVVMAYLAALLTRIQSQFPTEERLREIRQLTEYAVKHAHDHPMPWVAKAKLLLLENKPKDAEQAARQAVAQDPGLDRGYTVLGEALIRQNELDKGLAEIRRGIEVGQGYLRARLILGIRLKDASRYNEAETEFLKVLEFEPDHPTALHNLGEIYLEIGHEERALPRLRRALELGEWRSGNSLGNLYLNRGQNRKALPYFIEAYKIGRHPTLARNLAETYEEFGQADEARRWYSTAVERFDNQLEQGGSRAELLNGRSFCAAKLGRFGQAFDDIKEAIKLKPNENRFLVRAAEVYLLADRRQKAFEYLEQAVQAGFSRDEIRKDLIFQRYLDDPDFRAILEGD